MEPILHSLFSLHALLIALGLWGGFIVGRKYGGWRAERRHRKEATA